MLATEGTYPFHGGGVSTWCEQLCAGIDGVDFSVLAVTGSDHVGSALPIAPNIRGVHQVALWPTGDPSTRALRGPFSGVLERQSRATERRVREGFVPALSAVLREVFTPAAADADALVDALVAMGRFLRRHDYRCVMRTAAVWDAFVAASEEAGRDPEPRLAEVSLCARWLYHLLMPLEFRVEGVTVFHATVASSCALPGIVARLERGTCFLLTEHGVYLRERYLSVSASGHGAFVRRFLMGVARVIARACYAVADVIAPVATCNTRWQLPWGAPEERIRVVHNGVDTSKFRPSPKPEALRGRPVAVAAARIFALKDIETMIRAAAVARRTVPDLLLNIYGSLTADVLYTERCRALIASLDLGGVVFLRGHHAQPHALYCEGDISVLSSISEGFPYTVLESMACGVPCVVTDVGGVREAVGDTGIVVPPRDPEALGGAMAALLTDHERCRRLARLARDRVVSLFTVQRQLKRYEEIYRLLDAGSRGHVA